MVATEESVVTKITESFPNAVPNKELVSKTSTILEKYGYGSNSLVATSLCCDEVARCLEHDLASVYGPNFTMGGLAGVPFCGKTSFGAMAAHIPDGGSCLVVFGPHVGVDSTGAVGTVERRGRQHGGSCCGSAVAASKAIQSDDLPTPDPLDFQQSYVTSLLRPHKDRLNNAENPQAEIPYALYDVQKEMIKNIVTSMAGSVAGDGKIAVMGGIQINTPDGVSDYYLPLSFELYDNKGALVAEDLWESSSSQNGEPVDECTIL